MTDRTDVNNIKIIKIFSIVPVVFTLVAHLILD